MKTIKPSVIKNPDAKYGGEEPEAWEKILPKNRNVRILQAFNFYNYACGRDQAVNFFIYWAEHIQKIPKSDLDVIKSLHVKNFRCTLCWLARMITKGFIPNKKELNCMMTELDRLKNIETPNIKQVSIPVVKPNIQDYILDKFKEDMGELEGEIDEYFVENKPFSTLDFLKKNNVSVQHINKLPNILNSRIQELTDYIAGNDDQLNEGYSHLGKSKAKKAVKFFNEMINESIAYSLLKKSTKAKRKRKPVSIEKLVSKVIYMKAFEELKLTSINPKDIVEASELWVYNTKYRKIGRYVGVMNGTLTVKGTRIVGFDEKSSISKKLRKPMEQLQQFITSSKPQLRKFLSEIKSKESFISPRINKDIILLKAIK